MHPWPEETKAPNDLKTQHDLARVQMTAGSPWQSAESDSASYAVSPTLSVRDFDEVVEWPFHSFRHSKQTTAADVVGTGRGGVGNQAQGTVSSV